MQQILKKRDQASRLMDQGRHEKAAALLRTCHRRWGNSPVFLAGLATAYTRLFDFERANKCVEKLLEKHGGEAQIVRFAGDTLVSMKRDDAAMEVYGRLSHGEDSCPDACLRMAMLLERQGRLDEADEHLGRVLSREPGSEQGRFLHAVLQTRRGQLEEAGEALYGMLSGGLTDREIQWKAGHQLAAVLDKLESYSDAAQVLVAVKQGMEKDYAPEIKAARNAFEVKRRAVRKLSEEMTAADVARWRAEAEGDPLPVALLVGHPRSGTTLLENILERHSALASVEETACMEDQVFRAVFGVAFATPELFERDFLDRLPTSKTTKARQLYHGALQQFLPSAPTRVTLDKNPMLTHFMAAAQRFFPEVKSLVALRDPRAVCLSCFQQPVGVNTSNVSWLRIEDTVAAYNDIMGAWLRLRDILPDGWLEVRYEDLVEDTGGIARRVSGFLGLDWEDQMLERGASQRTIYSPTYAEATKPVYRSALEHWKNYGDLLAPHEHALRPTMEALGY